MSCGLCSASPSISSSSAERHFVQARLKLHPPWPNTTFFPHLPIIPLNFIQYSCLYTSVYILQLHFINMEPTASQVRNHYSQKIQEAHVVWAVSRACKKTINFHCQSNVLMPTQHLGIVLGIANIRVIIVIKQDDDDTNQEISDDDCEDPGEFTLSSDIEEDDLDSHHEVLHVDQALRDKTLRTWRVPLPKKWSSADTVIACNPLPNLPHPPGAIAPPLLKRQKSAINILRESVIVPAQALPLPKAGGYQSDPQPKASGDHNVCQHNTATSEVAKLFMEAVVFTKTTWPFISDEKYLMVDEAWQLAFEAQDHQQALAGAPVGTPSVCRLPSGPSHEIDRQTREAVSVYSVFCSSIGHMIILNPKDIHS